VCDFSAVSECKTYSFGVIFCSEKPPVFAPFSGDFLSFLGTKFAPTPQDYTIKEQIKFNQQLTDLIGKSTDVLKVGKMTG
jgi:hypothetical protein